MNTRRPTVLAVLLAAALSLASAQDRPVPGSFVRAREHAASIAQELVAHCPPDSAVRIAVLVEGTGTRFLLENALLDALRAAGVTGTLQANARPEDPVLHVFVLDQSRDFAPAADGRYVRTIRTAVEGRLDRLSGPHLLGGVSRTAVDTVATVESGAWTESEESSGVLDTLVTPFIVIGGVALVVYLLFTVRS
jgi:hypothetical protein